MTPPPRSLSLQDKTEALLRAMPGTHAQIRERTNFAERSTKRWVAELRACGWAHVGGWERSHPGGYQPVLHAGPGRDVPCRLKKIPAHESVRRSRAKAEREGRLAGQRERDRVAKLVKRRAARGVSASPFDALLSV